MSQATADGRAAGEAAEATGTDDDPDVEEDLFAEELRIDGICGVY